MDEESYTAFDAGEDSALQMADRAQAQVHPGTDSAV
jgi:hypothetical protein